MGLLHDVVPVFGLIESGVGERYTSECAEKIPAPETLPQFTQLDCGIMLLPF